MARPRLHRIVPPLAALALASRAVLAQTAPPAAPRGTAPTSGSATAATAATAATGARGGDAATTPAERARRALVVARVGETAITVGEFEDMLNDAPPPVRQSYVDPARRREYLENMIQTMLLADEARRRGLDRTPELSSAARRILAQRLEQVAVLGAVTPDSVSDAEVAAYYAGHVHDYQQPEFRRATVLYLADRPAAEQAAMQARAARGDMRRVQALVRERSVDAPSREHDGDLFYFRRSGGTAGESTVPPAVAEAAFVLAREMDVSPPVALPDGRFAVVVLTGIRPALSRTLQDAGVANSIRGFIVRERRAQRQAQLLEDVRTRLHPEVHEERLEQLRLPQPDLGNVPAFDPADRVPRREPTSGASPVPPPAPPANREPVVLPAPAPRR